MKHNEDILLSPEGAVKLAFIAAFEDKMPRAIMLVNNAMQEKFMKK